MRAKPLIALIALLLAAGLWMLGRAEERGLVPVTPGDEASPAPQAEDGAGRVLASLEEPSPAEVGSARQIFTAGEPLAEASRANAKLYVEVVSTEHGLPVPDHPLFVWSTARPPTAAKNRNGAFRLAGRTGESGRASLEVPSGVGLALKAGPGSRALTPLAENEERELRVDR